MMAKLFKREKYLSRIRGFYHATDIIKVITGLRRCGKYIHIYESESVSCSIGSDSL